MMKCEFENLIGHEITSEEYQKVETVYMAWDYKDMSKRKIADLYKHDREFVVDTLYNYIAKYHGHCLDELKRENECLKMRVYKRANEVNELEIRIEELETQLHQYKALFSDMEKNMTVNLYKTLLGVAE